MVATTESTAPEAELISVWLIRGFCGRVAVIGWFGVIRYVEGTGVLNVRQWFSLYRHRSVVFHIVKAAK